MLPWEHQGVGVCLYGVYPSDMLLLQYKLKHAQDTTDPSSPKKSDKFLQDPVDFSGVWYQVVFLCQCEGPLQNGEQMEHVHSILAGPLLQCAESPRPT